MLTVVTTETAWERALKRASARGLEAIFVKLSGCGPESDEYWKVTSTSNPGTYHYVRLNFSANGIGSSCDCEAALNDRACCHTMAALRASDELHSRPATVIPVQAPRRPTLRELLADD